MKFNKVVWCFVVDSGAVARLSWWSDFKTINYYLKTHHKHWVEV